MFTSIVKRDGRSVPYDLGKIETAISKAMEAFRESRTKVAEVLSDDSNLKGPSKESISQSAIDDMLAQLGM